MPSDPVTLVYKQWIASNVDGDGYGKCAEITQRMADAFPELRRVRGHYYCVAWGERGHWWLVASDGTIVDPTASQFPSRGNGVYVEHKDSDPEPTGMCPNCGGYIYGGGEVCSDECGNSYVAYLNSERWRG